MSSAGRRPTHVHADRTGIRNATVLWLAIALLLFVPAHIGFSYLQSSALDWRNLLGTLGVVGVVLASSWLARHGRRGWALVAALVLIALFFVRMLFCGLVRFSGRDFDADFFLHLGLISLRVAVQQYPWLFVLFALGALVAIAALVLVSRRLWMPSGRQAGVIVFVSLVAIVLAHDGMPEWHLLAATHAWFQPKQLSLPNGRMAVWRKSPLVNVVLVGKQSLWAKPATPPRNLVFLYIESGGLGLMESSRYPDLMPNMKRLVAEHSFIPYLNASSYVTIEGEANTQCGTLLPFEHGSDSMAGFDNMVEQMPCLGDVLHAAGYRQSYLGGAGKSFAGKGRFLETHDYDKVMGIGDWRKLGLDQRKGTWGLSDADLFKQSFAELKRLKASGKPYNLTMLTIGTHLPGFAYRECKPYHDGSERFLNAVYCSDQLIGKWVGKLEADGWLDDNTILVITGDHNFFPNPEMKRLFGERAVENRVLPFVVIGHDLPRPKQQHGAGFDIAPTVLDLLGVQTNAKFAMGRSLLRDDRVLDYFPSRYVDIYDGKPWQFADPFDCNPANTTRIPGRQPLSQCERQELATILRAQARAYSAPPVRMRCGSAHPAQVSVPAGSDAPLVFRVSGQEQAGRFTWSERPVEANKPGLYLLALNPAGRLLWRDYAPPDQVGKTFAERPDLTHAALLLVAWRPGDKLVSVPGWLSGAGVGNRRGAWLFDVRSGQHLVPQTHSGSGASVSLDSAGCRQLLQVRAKAGHAAAGRDSGF